MLLEVRAGCEPPVFFSWYLPAFCSQVCLTSETYGLESQDTSRREGIKVGDTSSMCSPVIRVETPALRMVLIGHRTFPIRFR